MSKKSETTRISIYHTNDIHADFNRLESIAAYLKENRNENDFYFDSGDFVDLKDLIVQADRGISAIEIFNSLHPDAMAIGNNEIDLGHDDLDAMASHSMLLCCNITDNNNHKLGNMHDYVILSRAGRRFLIIGIAPYYSVEMTDNNYNGFFCLYNLKVHACINTIRQIIDDHQGQFDFCILLSHSGLTAEHKIMEAIPRIDLLLGGHSHSLEADGKYNQCGKFGECLGKITLELTDSAIKIVKNENIPVPALQNEDYAALLNEKKQYADQCLDEDLFANESLSFNAYQECALINFVCDALLDYFDADFALMHNGIANFSLNLPVSRKSLLECFPSKLNPTTFEIEGWRLMEAIKLSFNEEHIRKDGKGAGFRGTTLGTLSYSHNVHIDQSSLTVTIDGQSLDPNCKYTIVTDDYLQRGTGYGSLSTPDDDASWHVWFIRDLIQHYIQNKEIYRLSKIRRIN